MKLLLDTHTILWWLSNDPSLSAEARNIIAQKYNTAYVSAASAWEIAIKKSLGKLDAPDDFEQTVILNGFKPLSINFSHSQLAGELPRHHDDPFDRMLIAQSKLEQLTLISNDKKLRHYDVTLIPA